jgi:hypothetical protein
MTINKKFLNRMHFLSSTVIIILAGEMLKEKNNIIPIAIFSPLLNCLIVEL